MFYIDLHKPGSFCHTVPFPSSWDELTTEELELIATEQMTSRDQAWENKAIIFHGIIDRRARASRVLLPKNWGAMLNYEDAASQGFDAIDYLYTSNERTVNPYPTLSLGYFSFYGPANNFDKITCGEFEDCEFFFNLFQQETESNHLARIASILWRQKGKAYAAEHSERLLKKFEKIPPQKLLTIYIWYCGCRNQLPKLFPNVYDGGGEGGQRDIAAFTKCIHHGAGPKNGDRDKIRITPLKEFLFDMELEAIKVKEFKEQQNKLK